MMCLLQQIKLHGANSYFRVMDKDAQMLIMHLLVALRFIHVKLSHQIVNLIVINLCKMDVSFIIQSVIQNKVLVQHM